MNWFDLLVVQGTLRSLLQHHSSKASLSVPSPPTTSTLLSASGYAYSGCAVKWNHLVPCSFLWKLFLWFSLVMDNFLPLAQCGAYYKFINFSSSSRFTEHHLRWDLQTLWGHLRANTFPIQSTKFSPLIKVLVGFYHKGIFNNTWLKYYRVFPFSFHFKKFISTGGSIGEVTISFIITFESERE